MALSCKNSKHGGCLKRNEKAIAGMARACPENFEHKLFLIKAETARVQGKITTASGFFQQAIHSARKHEFIHMEAIANELAAKLFLAQGFEKVGKTFLTEAAGHIGNPIRVTLQSSPVENRTDILLSAINYVQRTGKTQIPFL